MPFREAGRPGLGADAASPLLVLEEGSLHVKRVVHQMIPETRCTPWKTCTRSHGPGKQWAAKMDCLGSPAPALS